ncbi:putative protein S-acyltransferase 19 [Nymphaea thermarum]|nr:putative protein S-acyltransferase 19 [Nymphaea thermarum]
MARRHGWQLPAHTFQVVAITVFFLLVVAFYAFFAPFLGKNVFEYVAMGVYTPVALLVFILYVRCTAIDPADPGILISPEERLAGKKTPGEPAEIELMHTGNPAKKKFDCCSCIGGFLCGWLVKEDCRKDEDIDQQEANEEDALFCTLCNAEVRKFSKHCRSCDKCVDGFDHHCRLMVESGIGIAVLVRCFVDKKETENQIIDRLGNGFSRAPFAIVVALCTAVSLLASIPLGELFFFHMILIRKGITTYEYVVAMRTQSEPPGPSVDGDQQSVPPSPTSSAATGLSGGSSLGLGLQYKGVAWCTPPRIFVDQDEIIPHLEPGRVPSTVDPDTLGNPDGGKRVPKRQVRISAWKLAKLDSNEAMKAAAKARASSSVLRPISARQNADSGYCSSENASSISVELGPPKDARSGHRLSLKNSYPPSRASRDDIEAGTRSVSSLSSPAHTNGSAALSPLPTASPDAGKMPFTVGKLMTNREHFNPIYQPSAGRSPWSAKAGDAGENILSHALDEKLVKKNRGNIRENQRPSVFWDQAAGRYVSVLPTGGDARPFGNRASSSHIMEPEISTAAAVFQPEPPKRAPYKPAAMGEQPKALSGTSTQTENLVCTEQSIFFGGPLLVADGTESARFRASSRPTQESASSSWIPEGRAGKGKGSDQFPVFVPKDSEASQSGLP